MPVCVTTLIVAFILFCAPLGAAETKQRSFLRIGSSHLHRVERLHRRVDQLVIDGRFREAVRACQDIVLLEPDDKWAYERLGAVSMILGDYPHAKDAFENALTIDPQDEEALRGLKKIADPDAA